MDRHVTMKGHIKNICKSSMIAIRSIGQIRPYLSSIATKSLIHSFVTSRIDTCNSLLYGLPQYQIQQLQRIQNTSARLVHRTPRRKSVTPLLQQLHWLPVHLRIVFKILLFTFKALKNASPNYISSLITPRIPARSLRSSSQHRLHVPTVLTQFYGSRAFQAASPSLWNSLPLHIRQCTTIQSFKSSLKTSLFSKL